MKKIPWTPGGCWPSPRPRALRGPERWFLVQTAFQQKQNFDVILCQRPISDKEPGSSPHAVTCCCNRSLVWDRGEGLGKQPAACFR